MKVLKAVAFLPALISLSFAGNAIAAQYPCPSPSQILVLFPTPIFAMWFSGVTYPTAIGNGSGIGGVQVGAFQFSSDQNVTVNGRPGWACFYGSSTHATGNDLIKKAEQIPTAMQPLLELKELQDSNIGFIVYEKK